MDEKRKDKIQRLLALANDANDEEINDSFSKGPGIDASLWN